MGVLREMAEKWGHKVLPLAPYSPELNPIEKVWANIKRYLRTVLSDYARFDDALLSYFDFNWLYIESEPWEHCLKRYDREHTFFYAAPPYWQAVGYDSAFDWSQYELLAKAMAESKGKVMLSINGHPDLRELFKDFRITQLELAYTVGRDKTGKTSGELVICNW